MSRKHGTLLAEFLTAVGEATGFFEWPLEYSDAWRRKQLSRPKVRYYQVLWDAKKRGLISEIRKNGKKFLQLTSRGELARLVGKMNVQKQNSWDGKWRVVIFDIPEDSRGKRDQLRLLLKQKGFAKLQASVFVNPYPLNREAVSYLKQSGLMSYIRILKVEEMDNDADLKRKFHLK